MKTQTLDIGGVTYTVEVVEDLHYVDSEGKKQTCEGRINFFNTKIMLSSGTPDHMKPQTVLHEALHAMFYQTGHTDNEIAILALEYALSDFIASNPQFIAELQESRCNATAKTRALLEKAI